ncbi:multidrug transporter, MFS family [Renibacterium salmoninarum ATCC 33209]|uniref:Multidrug transporter, MFS family n=1 Tax=Renibacterium salmoninarum (strain ATCC 33209 / DSM 20767 / JCM 11484 / NBRC 15589 / NCIMB 2235) TaxID=288705 RepID=A9WP12_RENSM|nr:multidrug transporter, MFS family [Renibacterium salmoninarum ATCC 33209]
MVSFGATASGFITSKLGAKVPMLLGFSAAAVGATVIAIGDGVSSVSLIMVGLGLFRAVFFCHACYDFSSPFLGTGGTSRSSQRGAQYFSSDWRRNWHRLFRCGDWYRRIRWIGAGYGHCGDLLRDGRAEYTSSYAIGG